MAVEDGRLSASRPPNAASRRCWRRALSLKQIANAQGAQHDTVRKQLRAIYQKTSTNRQPELVRLLLHLPHTSVHD